jgi:two-component system CheB/CheR fusion protein
MLVDDEADILEVFRRALEMDGYYVDTFNDPGRAIYDYKAEFYNMILLDIRMPGLNGFEVARAIWQKDPNARICFMTAFEIYEEEAKKVFRDFNSHCFLKKPMTPKALIEHIEKHLVDA